MLVGPKSSTSKWSLKAPHQGKASLNVRALGTKQDLKNFKQEKSDLM